MPKWNVATRKMISARRMFSKSKLEPDNEESNSSSSSSESGSVSSSESGSVSSSESEPSQSNSKKSVDSSGAKIVQPVKLATIPNFDDSSSGSSSESEFGCGVYRRREDLSVSSASKESSSSSSSSSSHSSSSSEASVSSSSRSEDDSSKSSSSDSKSDGESVSSHPSPPQALKKVAQKSASEPVLQTNDVESELKRKPSFRLLTITAVTRFKKKKSEKMGDALVPKKIKKINASTSSIGSRQSGDNSLHSERDSSNESDNDSSSASSSESSSSTSEGNKVDKSEKSEDKDVTKPPSHITVTSLDMGDKKSDTNSKERRRSSMSSVTSDASPLTPSLHNEIQANMMRRHPSFRADTDGTGGLGAAVKPKASESTAPRTAKSSWGKLAKAVKKENTESTDVEDVFSSMLLQAKKRKEERLSQTVVKNEDEVKNNNDQVEEASGSENKSDLFALVLQKAREVKEEKRRQSIADGESISPEEGSTNTGNDLFLKVLQKAREKKEGKEREDKESFDGQHNDEKPAIGGNDLFANVLRKAREIKEKNAREEQSEHESTNGNDSTNNNNSSRKKEESRFSKMTQQRKSGGNDSDEEFEAPKLVYDRTSMKFLVDELDNESSGSDDSDESQVNEREDKQRNHSDEDSDEESCSSSSSEKSDQESLSTESSDEDDDMSDRVSTDDDEDVLSIESQMSILTPIAEESVASRELDVSSVQESTSSSSSEDCIDELGDDKPKQEEIPTQNQIADAVAEPTGGEAMLTDMPDENDTTLAKRKAVQAVMKDRSLSAVERNKKIQDIMAGRVELPVTSSKPSENHSNESSVQNVAGPGGASEKQHNDTSKESSNQRQKRKVKKASEHQIETSQENYSQESTNERVHTSNSTAEIVDSYVDEQKEISVCNDSDYRKSTESSTTLLDIDRNIDQSLAKEHKVIFQTARSLAEAEETANKTSDEEALLTALTIALYDLDSQWDIDSFLITRKPPNLQPKPTKCTLRMRDKTLSASNKWDVLLDKISTEVQKQKKAEEKSLDDSNRSISENHMSLIDGAEGDFSNEPKLPSVELTKATIELKKSPTIEKISQKLLREPSSEDKGEDDIDQSITTSVSQHENKPKRWVSSIRKLDPRWQIRSFFDAFSESYDNTEIFTVWRPTSYDAIMKMMRGEGVGKGLDIKGKSAKCGDLSGYVPFLQIHDNKHIPLVRILKGDRTKIFFTGREARDAVGKLLGQKAKEMAIRVAKAKFTLAKIENGEVDYEQKAVEVDEEALMQEIDCFDVEESTVILINNYAPDRYGLEVACRVLWEGLVVNSDISRDSRPNSSTGRASQPTFQEMNFATLRKQDPNKAIPVLYQYSKDDPFDPRMLIIAYEEEGRVVPVVSDFDCFLIGSRDFSFKEDMADDQIELLDWCISQIEWILDNQTDTPDSWTAKWLAILKHAVINGFVPKMPPFGYGDPSSYALIEAAVHKFKKMNGAVRHGPECFNYFFPQDLDSELLVIFPGNKIWQYVSVSELQSILIDKIREGFTVPLNPKWILCDPGWMDVFVELLKSRRPSVQNSVNMWFPRKSGLRERIMEISKRHPQGFRSSGFSDVNMSLAIQEYERFLILWRAKQKLKGFAVMSNLHALCKKRTEREMKQADKTLKGKNTNIEHETIDSIEKTEFIQNSESNIDNK